MNNNNSNNNINPAIKQRDAIDINKSIWVDASAGTGKTKVLTDRVLNLLLHDIPLSKILCLTFTKAAATEMKIRIQQQLLVWATCPYEELLLKLSNLLGILPEEKIVAKAKKLFFEVVEDSKELQILTIHSFCQKILSIFSLESGISVNFSLLSDREQKVLLHEAVSELLSLIRKKDNSSINEAIDYLLNNDFTISNLLLNLQEMLLLNKNIDYLQNCSLTSLKQSLEHLFKIDLKINKQEYFKNYSITKIQWKKTHDVLENSKNKTDQQLLQKIKKLLKYDKLDQQSYELLISIFFTSNNTQRVKIITNGIIAKNDFLKIFLTQESEKILQLQTTINNLHCVKNTYYLVILAQQMQKFYQQKKHYQNKVDFNDLIYYTKQILQKNEMDWVFYKLDVDIEHILVDEAQDTSSDQWDILLQLSKNFFTTHHPEENNRTLFVVGDRKQSIYSFQGAEPELFIQLKNFFQQQVQQAQKNWQAIELTTSFRSTQAILNLVNNVCAKLMGDNFVNHNSFRINQPGKIELWQLITPENFQENKNSPNSKVNSNKENLQINQANKLDTGDNSIQPITTNSQILAKKIANYIEQQITKQTILVSRGKAVNAGDFLILLQRRSSLMYQIIRALKKKKIPVSGADRFILTEHIAIQDLILLVEFLLFPKNDYALMCILKSPFFNWTEEKIMQFSLYEEENNTKNNLFNKLLRYSPQTHKILKKLKEKSLYLNVYELLTHILITLRYKKNFIARMGANVDEVLNELLNFTYQFLNEDDSSLQNFISVIKSTNIEIKRELSGNSNVVRIMTIHGAKGLQAPIVILPDTVRVPSNKNLLIWNKNKKLNGDKDAIPIWNAIQKFGTSEIQTLKEKANLQVLNEYYRLLYVALTRAEDILIVAGYNHNDSINEKSWYALIKETMQNIGIKVENNYTYEIQPNERLPNQSSPNQLLPKLSLQNNCNVENQKECLGDKLNNIDNLLIPKDLLENINLALEETESISPSTIKTFYNVSATTVQYSNNISSIKILEKTNESAIKGNSAEIGIYIHKLLEILPNKSQQLWEQSAKTIAQFYIKNGSNSKLREQYIKISKHVFNLIKNPQFIDIFGEYAYMEVPICGKAYGKQFSGKIDRLIINEKKAIIIDFKTNKIIPNINEIPDQYLMQLKIYRALLQKIYPQKDIQVEIVWTAQELRVPVSISMLESLKLNIG